MTQYAEKPFRALSGWLMLAVVAAEIAGVVAVIVRAVRMDDGEAAWPIPILAIALILTLIGFFIVNPNDARVLVLFGRYRGTVRQEGFYWTNPFTVRRKVSLKQHNFNSDRLKVNDLAGNPIEIAAVVVWRVRDTAKTMFEVEDYDDFVEVQSEAAVRALASIHPYDSGQDDTITTTLRGSTKEVAQELEEALQRRLDTAGIDVVEARLSHLAYAPEIASAMLQRQQAAAVVAARQKIVEGAVGMVETALEMLDEGRITDLDEERKATLVGNLLVVLCGSHAPTPILNTGSLYQ